MIAIANVARDLDRLVLPRSDRSIPTAHTLCHWAGLRAPGESLFAIYPTPHPSSIRRSYDEMAPRLGNGAVVPSRLKKVGGEIAYHFRGTSMVSDCRGLARFGHSTTMCPGRIEWQDGAAGVLQNSAR